MRLLLTTARAVVLLELREDFRVGSVNILEEGNGIYFGVTRGHDRYYVVSRNLELGQAVPTHPNLPTNAIAEWSLDCRKILSRWTHSRFKDLHQIRFSAGGLYVLTATHPHLLKVDPLSQSIIGEFDLLAPVPGDLERKVPINTENPTDLYHFNSLTFTRGRLFVLAHNWSTQPSFALELSACPGLPVRNIHRNLGRSSHDILASEQSLYILDSNAGRLIVRGKRSAEITLPMTNSVSRFPRGLAASDRHFFVTSGLHSAERSGRQNSQTFLTVISRQNLQIRADICIGDFGNSFDVTLLDDRDWTDMAPPTFLERIVAGAQRVRRRCRPKLVTSTLES